MCQLLGMNANVPTDICFSFTGFRQRGGATDHHADGWGIGFFEDAGCRLFIDTEPSADSPIAALVSAYPIRSHHVIAHIRKATQGLVRLQNTHPFQREIYWAALAAMSVVLWCRMTSGLNATSPWRGKITVRSPPNRATSIPSRRCDHS